MSSVANWANTAKATLWRNIGVDDWSNVATFAQPVLIDVSYAVKIERMKAANGNDFVSNMKFWTEYASAKNGDFVAVGDFMTTANPLDAGAAEIKLVLRDQDVFENVADDYTLVT